MAERSDEGLPASSRGGVAAPAPAPQGLRQIARGLRPAVFAAIDLHPLDPARIGVEHFGFECFRAGNELAAHRHMAGAHHQIAAQRVDVLCGFADVEFVADHGAHVIEAGAADGDERSVALARHRRCLGFVVLVGDIADDQLDQVFHRDQAVAAAIFVDDQCQMNARRLHLGEQVERRHGRRRVEHVADDFGRLQRHGQVDLAEIEIGRGRRVLVGGGGGIGGAGSD